MYNGKLIYELIFNANVLELAEISPEAAKDFEENFMAYELLTDFQKKLCENIYIAVIRDYIKNSNI